MRQRSWSRWRIPTFGLSNFSTKSRPIFSDYSASQRTQMVSIAYWWRFFSEKLRRFELGWVPFSGKGCQLWAEITWGGRSSVNFYLFIYYVLLCIEAYRYKLHYNIRASRPNGRNISLECAQEVTGSRRPGGQRDIFSKVASGVWRKPAVNFQNRPSYTVRCTTPVVVTENAVFDMCKSYNVRLVPVQFLL